MFQVDFYFFAVVFCAFLLYICELEETVNKNLKEKNKMKAKSPKCNLVQATLYALQ